MSELTDLLKVWMEETCRQKKRSKKKGDVMKRKSATNKKNRGDAIKRRNAGNGKRVGDGMMK